MHHKIVLKTVHLFWNWFKWNSDSYTCPAFQETMDTAHYIILIYSDWLKPLKWLKINVCQRELFVKCCFLVVGLLRVGRCENALQIRLTQNNHLLTLHVVPLPQQCGLLILLWHTKQANLFSTLEFYCDQGWNREPFLIQIHFH